MKKLLFWGVGLWALAAAPVRAQTTPGKADFVLVRVMDYGSRADIYLTSSPDSTEHIEVKTGLLNVDKSNTLVNQGLYAVMQKLFRQGYVLQQTVGIPYGTGAGITTWLFVKSR